MNPKPDNASTKQLIGAVAGGAVGAGAGMAGAIASISFAGSATGLSCAGISSGLAAIGGGTMLGGLVVATGGVALLAIGGVIVGRMLFTKSKSSRTNQDQG
jgi:hypothetical protein